MQAKDSHFEQTSNKLAAKSWELPAMMGHCVANQLWLVTTKVTVSILYQLQIYVYMHACMYVIMMSLFIIIKVQCIRLDVYNH